jgi:CheY-like chemotaxis protein
MNPQPNNSNAGKILVIDDNPIVQRAIYFSLRDRGYTVLMCGEISESLAIVRSERPQVILLDLHFPPVVTGGTRDGFWALEWLRHMEEARNTPVIIISSDPPEMSEAAALAGGAAAYFQKPIDKHELAAVVGEVLAKAGPPPRRENPPGVPTG